MQLAMFVVVFVGLMLQRRSGARDEDRSSWMSIAPLPLPPRVRMVAASVGALAGGGLVLMGLVGSSATAVSLMFIVATASIALSIFIVTGMSGQLSLGQFAVAGVGAVAGIRVATATGDMLVGLAAAGIAGALTTLLIGLPGLRLRGLFAAVTTLAFALVAREWLLAQTWMAGFGRSLDDVHVVGLEIRTTQARFGFCVAVYLVLVLAVHNVNRSGLGRRMRALRDNENQARGFTVGPLSTRASSFAFAGFVAGSSGLLLGVAASNITAANFPSSQSITIVAAAVLGGLQGVFGSLLGALYLVGVPRFLPLDNAGLAATSFGWLALLLVAPQGIGGLLNRLVASLSGNPAQTPAAVAGGGALSLGRFAHQRHGFDGVVLEARGLHKHYGGVRAVDGVDIELRQGETLGLIGGNGAGKTTLFELLGGFVKPDSGTIAYRGRDISTLPAHQRARLGIVRSFQDAALFSTFTVRESVLVALERRHPTKVLPALLGLRRHERRQRSLADELLTMCGLRGYADSVVSTLSTGTRRIAEIACMIALDPDVLLLDEPSAGIAQRETEALVGVIRTVREQLGTSIVLIEHDMPFIRALSDRIVVMEAGKVLAVGEPSTVLSDERVIASYLGTDTAAIDRSGERQTESVRKVVVPSGSSRRPHWVLPTREVRNANRVRRLTQINRQLAWVTLAWLVLATASSWSEPRLGMPRWIAWTANNLFTVNFILHGVMSAYVYRMPRPRSTPRVMQVYLGYSIALFTLVSQTAIGTEPLHSITFAVLWLFIGGHVTLAIRSRSRRAEAPAASMITGPSIAPSVGRRTTPIRSTAAVRTPAAVVPDGLSWRFPPLALASIGAVVTIIGFVVTSRGLDLRKGGGSLMPAVFAGIVGIHIVLGAQWFRLRTPSGLRSAPVAILVLGGLIYDNVVLGLGGVLGRSDVLRVLSVPRYWIHAIATPLLILLVLEIGERCGLSWTGRRRKAWTFLAFVLIGFGLGHDGFGQKLRFTTKGGTARYANEALSGPPISAIAVIVVVLAVAIMIWHRGASSLMAVSALLMLIGAAVGASVPLLGNLAECFFVISLLAGMQAAAGRRATRITTRRQPGTLHTVRIGLLSIPWTTISIGLLVAILGAVHASANVSVAHGPVGPVIGFMAAAIVTVCAAYVLYTAVLPGSQAASMAAGSLGLFAIDTLLLLPGNIVGERTNLERLHQVRLVLVPLAAALLVPFVGSVMAATFRRTQNPRRDQIVGATAFVVGAVISVLSSSGWRSSGYALRSAPTGLATPGLVVIGVASLAMIRTGREILRRTASLSPLVLAVLALLSTWGGQFNPLVLAAAPVALAGALTMAWTSASEIDRRTRNQRGSRPRDRAAHRQRPRLRGGQQTTVIGAPR